MSKLSRAGLKTNILHVPGCSVHQTVMIDDTNILHVPGCSVHQAVMIADFILLWSFVDTLWFKSTDSTCEVSTV